MSYFAQLGGDDAVMTAAEFAALSAADQTTFMQGVAAQMAPSIVGRVSVEREAVVIQGRYAVHNARVELSVDSGAFILCLKTRRALSMPGGQLVIGGPPEHPSREFLAELPQDTGGLLNRLLDTVRGDVRSLTLSAHELVLQLDDPQLVTLSATAAQRLTSVAHLTAYIAVEAEERWPQDPGAPLKMATIDSALEQRLQWGDSEWDAPPIPGYGLPPDAQR